MSSYSAHLPRPARGEGRPREEFRFPRLTPQVVLMKYQGCQDPELKLPFLLHPWFSEENTSTCGESLLLYSPEMLIKTGLPVKAPN